MSGATPDSQRAVLHASESNRDESDRVQELDLGPDRNIPCAILVCGYTLLEVHER
jgi:hypothetical protein